MISRRLIVLLVGLVVIAAMWGYRSRAAYGGAPQAKVHTPALINTCLITKNVAQLVEFYSKVLQIPAQTTGSDYAEFSTGVGVLAIFSADAQEKYIPHATEPANNRSAILEFEVGDVDQEYARLQSVVKDWVKPPTTQPWGTRSVYFRDPDGNLVNFFKLVKTR
jgi:uncharacterized glyoxalase superfamily protein PhnB